MTDYRIEELAAAAGATVRSVQSYRNRHLLPPPRRQGRIALFSDEHLTRLRLIADLIDRGYSLNAIGELLSGLHQGHDISDLLGVEAAASQPPSAAPVEMGRRDLDALFGARVDNTIRVTEKLGVMQRIEGDDTTDSAEQRYLVTNPDLFQAGIDLVAAGIPIEAVLAEALVVQKDVDEIARRFVKLVVDHIIDKPDGRPHDGSSLTELVRQLRPLAEVVVVGNLAPAIERHAHDELGARIDRLMNESSLADRAASEAS